MIFTVSQITPINWISNEWHDSIREWTKSNFHGFSSKPPCPPCGSCGNLWNIQRMSKTVKREGEAGPMKRPNRCKLILLRLMNGNEVETRGGTVLESSTKPCLHGSITPLRSTALPKTVKPCHPFSRILLTNAFRYQQRKHPNFQLVHQASFALPP